MVKVEEKNYLGTIRRKHQSFYIFPEVTRLTVQFVEYVYTIDQVAIDWNEAPLLRLSIATWSIVWVYSTGCFLLLWFCACLLKSAPIVRFYGIPMNDSTHHAAWRNRQHSKSGRVIMGSSRNLVVCPWKTYSNEIPEPHTIEHTVVIVCSICLSPIQRSNASIL